jgi:PAS domain S-box-containing protein
MILVVDDELHVRKGIARLLEKEGYAVREAATGAEGLRLADKVQPDLILLDVMLPDLDGLAVCREIKADSQRRQAFVVMLSGVRVDSESQAQGLEAGADGYITRPISNRELAARTKAFLRIKAAEAALQKSEKRYRDLVELAPVGIFRATSGGQVLDVNKEMARILGYESKEHVIRADTDLSQQLCMDSTSHHAFIQALRETGQVESFIARTRRADGSEIWISMNARISEGTLDGDYIIEGFFTDVTAHVEAQEALEAHGEALEERVAERTADLRKTINLMSGREVRMAELKRVIKQLRAQLEEVGLEPVADDPLLGEET